MICSIICFTVGPSYYFQCYKFRQKKGQKSGSSINLIEVIITFFLTRTIVRFLHRRLVECPHYN